MQEKILNLDKEKTLRFWHDMLEHGDGHHEGEEEGEEVEDGVELEGALQLHRLQLHLGCCRSAWLVMVLIITLLMLLMKVW